MWVALRFPLLPIEIFLRGSSAPEPFAVEERHCVLMCERKAAARGVRAGMAVSAARALVQRLRTRPRDPAGETEALLGIAAWAGQFTPGVALEFPFVVLIEISGSLKLFGGLESLAGRLRKGLKAMGWSTALAEKRNSSPNPAGSDRP
jgi:protein ImuB